MIMKRLLFIFIMTLGILHAAPLTLDEQIAQLQNAEPKERFELMNALKLRISHMNANERSSAIKQLKSQMHQKNASQKNSAMQQHQKMLASDQMQQMHKQNRTQGFHEGGGNPNRPNKGNGNGHSKR